MRPMYTDPDYMPNRWRLIVQRVATGEEWRAAAKAEGCSESYSRVIRTRMKKNPVVARELKQIQAAGSEATGVTLVRCIAQAQEDRDSARPDKAHMAAVQAIKLVCQLSGYLVEKIELVPDIRLRDALIEARRRGITYCPYCPHCQDSATKALTDRRPTGPDTDSGGPENQFGD